MYRFDFLENMRTQRQTVLIVMVLHQIKQKLVVIDDPGQWLLPGHFVRAAFTLGEILRHGATGLRLESAKRSACRFRGW